eukprot:2360261-Prymnesium_polylepis.1
MEAWQVSPHQRQAARHRRSGPGSGRGGGGTSARQGCGDGDRARSVARRAHGRRCDGRPGVSPLCASAPQARPACARTRRQRTDRSTFPKRACDARAYA